jgi:hypothetical protein
MKKLLSLFLAFAFLAGCSNEADVNTGDGNSTAETGGEVVEGEAALAAFYEYFEDRDTSFSRSFFQEASPAEPLDTLPPMPVQKEHLAQYDSFLVYSPDRSKAVDPYSHSYVLTKGEGKTRLASGSPDTELALIDTEKGTRQRLFYFGPSYVFLEAKWKDSATVLFAISELIGANRISPEIWEVDVNRLTKKVSRYPDTLTINLAEYKQQAANRD